ncbi:phosphotransferase [Streptomyces sp. NPDC005811]|uniref:phosphotransferase enzyme family protein n=1 Tax=Streptomyces sp. NPDC005811 TaxID=3154565 RepID=UPI0033D829B2
MATLLRPGRPGHRSLQPVLQLLEGELARRVPYDQIAVQEHEATVHLPDFDRPVWDAQTILHQGHALTGAGAHEQLGTDGTAALRKVAELITPALEEGGPDDRGRIHGDLHRENMIARPDGGVGVIDFDDCGTGHCLLDIATVLSSVHRIAHPEPGAYEEFARAYLDGYTQVRPLPTDFSRLLKPYLLLRDAFILNFVTTAAPVNADVASWGPNRITGILASMQAYLEGRAYPGALHMH